MVAVKQQDSSHEVRKDEVSRISLMPQLDLKNETPIPAAKQPLTTK